MKKELLARDLLFLILFFILVSIPTKRLIHFIAAHKESPTHELDTELMHQIEAVSNQLEKIKKQFDVKLTVKEKGTLSALVQKIDHIYADYKKNSHGLILLGPIGTVSIVLKEKRIKNDLLEIIITLFDLIRRHTTTTVLLPSEPIESIEEGLMLIRKISK